MMSRTQIALDPEMQHRAQQRARDLGISLAEYIRRLVTRDLGSSRQAANPSAVFDLGASGSSDIARHKKSMIGEAFAASHGKPRRRLVAS